MKRNHIKMCLGREADSGGPSYTLACCRHCSSTILERLWDKLSAIKTPQPNTGTIHPVTFRKSQLKLTGVLFCFIYSICFTCWCNLGQRMWAAAAPAFPEDEGPCLRGRDEEDRNKELVPFYTSSVFHIPHVTHNQSLSSLETLWSVEQLWHQLQGMLTVFLPSNCPMGTNISRSLYQRYQRVTFKIKRSV